jgi:EAL domain-containing protein (putative c-di-GMP-specific phosphodiesterase class I)
MPDPHDPAGDDVLEADLRNAIETGALEVHYQANVDALESQVLGFEALVRWQHPELGPIGPGRFIPIAERSELILEIGRFVLQSACEEGVRLLREVPDRRLTMSVNLSARQLADEGIVGQVATVLEDTGFEARLLCLELTESVLMDDLERVARRLTGLRSLGVCIAIDDFGTGYSSLAHLKRFHADILKIDRTFVDGLGRDQRDSEIVRAIISIGQSLNIDLIAEGVEHAEQLEQLLELGCTRMQGYFWSAPVRSGRLLETIERISRLGAPSDGEHVAPSGADGQTPDAGPAEQALLLLDHELRNPLTVISGYLDIFEQTQEGARAHAALAAMRRALVTMTRTLESFGSVHALEGGRPLQTRPLDVCALVASIVEELTPVIHDKRILVRQTAGGGSAVVDADEHATRLILVNLLTNADKYAPPGTDVHVTVEEAGDRMCVVVRDEGPGIAPQDVERVFEKFERASTSTKGYGLGLYLSRRLARQQGGDLVYAAGADGGATFSLSLARPTG